MEMIIALVLSMLVGLLGGALHIVVPPVDTDRAMWVRRLVAGLIVGIIMFFGGLDPRLFDIPSAGILLWFGSIISSGYVAIDVLKVFIDKFKPPATPTTAPEPNS